MQLSWTNQTKFTFKFKIYCKTWGIIKNLTLLADEILCLDRYPNLGYNLK